MTIVIVGGLLLMAAGIGAIIIERRTPGKLTEWAARAARLFNRTPPAP